MAHDETQALSRNEGSTLTTLAVILARLADETSFLAAPSPCLHVHVLTSSNSLGHLPRDPR
jgi:hypothetical protein